MTEKQAHISPVFSAVTMGPFSSTLYFTVYLPGTAATLITAQTRMIFAVGTVPALQLDQIFFASASVIQRCCAAIS